MCVYANADFLLHSLCDLSQLPSSSKWGQQSASVPPQSQNALSLAEIQKLEEEKERQARQEVRSHSGARVCVCVCVYMYVC